MIADSEFLTAPINEQRKKLFEASDDIFLFRQGEGDVGEVGEEDGRRIDRDVLIFTVDILNHLGHNVQGEEGVVELGDFIIAFQVGRYLFNDLADIG